MRLNKASILRSIIKDVYNSAPTLDLVFFGKFIQNWDNPFNNKIAYIYITVCSYIVSENNSKS